MRTSRPVAEKLGAIRQDPDLDGLLFGLISRATGGCREHVARLDHIHVVGAGRGLTTEVRESSCGHVLDPLSLARLGSCGKGRAALKGEGESVIVFLKGIGREV